MPNIFKIILSKRNVWAFLLPFIAGAAGIKEGRAQQGWATSVVDYQFTNTQNGFGQSPDFFPANVLGPVAASAGPTAPSSAPSDVCSMGKGGYITLAFVTPIIDGPGADFTVFENAFYYGQNQIFDEWMKVAVSEDGIEWRIFPYDSLTGAGLAGRTPTAAKGVDYFNPEESGGDSFDLATVGLTQARFVKVIDATQFQGPDRLSSDLDAVAALHLSTGVEATAQRLAVRISADEAIFSSVESVESVSVYDPQGALLSKGFKTAFNTFKFSSPDGGPFLLTARAGSRVYTYKFFRANL